MSTYRISLAPPLRLPSTVETRPEGFARGTLITTIFGPRPVERLMAGDLLRDAAGRIVELRSMGTVRAGAEELVRLTPSQNVPGLERALVVGAGQKLELQDWRTDVLYGQGALTAAAAMVDGQDVRFLNTPRLLYQLGLDEEGVILANGLPALVAGSAQSAQDNWQGIGQILGYQAGADLARGLHMQPGAC
jgi:hypothetical protein